MGSVPEDTTGSDMGLAGTAEGSGEQTLTSETPARSVNLEVQQDTGSIVQRLDLSKTMKERSDADVISIREETQNALSVNRIVELKMEPLKTGVPWDQRDINQETLEEPTSREDVPHSPPESGQAAREERLKEFGGNNNDISLQNSPEIIHTGNEGPCDNLYTETPRVLVREPALTSFPEDAPKTKCTDYNGSEQKSKDGENVARQASCDLCHKDFADVKLLWNHLQTHRKDLTQVCPVCKDTFLSKGRLRQHMLVHDQERRRLQCSFCEKTFLRSNSLRSHLMKHTRENLFDCTVCGKKFTTSYNLRMHLQRHAGGKTKKHTCEICSKTFGERYSLVNHVRLHTGEKPFACPHCPAAFICGNRLKRHQRYKHLPQMEKKPEGTTGSTQETTGSTEENQPRSLAKALNPVKRYTCDKCQKTYPIISALRRHLQIHTGEQPYSCPVCNTTFGNRKALIRHKKTHHTLLHTPRRNYRCQLCDKPFLSYQAYLSHKKLHAGEEPFSCTVCGSKRMSKSALTTHMKIHSDEQFACKYCQKIWKERWSLMRHMRSCHKDKLSTCEVCQKQFMNAEERESHVHVKHGGGNGTSEKPKHAKGKKSSFPDNNLFSCTKCPRSFGTLPALDRHELHHTPEKMYSCQLCGMTIPFSSWLKWHMTLHTGGKPYVCDVCTDTFSTLPQLRRHEKVHKSEENLKCKVCDKTLANKRTLNHHLRWHAGKKVHSCTVCNKLFAGRKDLHMVCHTWERQFLCKQCPKRFRRELDLKSHSKIHVPVKRYVCEVCHARFSFSKLLMSHLNREHYPATDFADIEKEKTWPPSSTELRTDTERPAWNEAHEVPSETDLLAMNSQRREPENMIRPASCVTKSESHEVQKVSLSPDEVDILGMNSEARGLQTDTERPAWNEKHGVSSEPDLPAMNSKRREPEENMIACASCIIKSETPEVKEEEDPLSSNEVNIFGMDSKVPGLELVYIQQNACNFPVDAEPTIDIKIPEEDTQEQKVCVPVKPDFSAPVLIKGITICDDWRNRETKYCILPD